MESGNNNPNQQRSASYSKLNDWPSSSNKKQSTPFTSNRSSLPKWKCVLVGTIIACCIGFIGLGMGFGLTSMESKLSRKLPQIDMRPPTSSFDSAAVAGQSDVCANIGRDILRKGGSAVDAAIASMLCEGVYNPQSAGIGGGFFMMIYNNETKKVEVIDARETAPLKATEDMYDLDPDKKKTGGLSVAVPGELRGYWMAHQRYGKLNWSELFQPTIELCEKGIVISLGVKIALWYKVKQEVLNEPSMSSLFRNNKTGDLVIEGDVIKMPELARTLRTIAEKGAEEFYRGEIAKKLVADIAEFGGIITLKDLEIYQPLIREPVMFNLSNSLTFYSMPPPGSGLLLGFILRVLDEFKLNKTNVDNEILMNHIFVEVCKFAYAKRSELGDPDFTQMTNFTDFLTSSKYLKKVLAAIDKMKTHDTKYYESTYANEADHGTVHVSVLASNGDAVSITSTINLWFGAIIRSMSTGIILNNEMDDFSRNGATNFYGILPSSANFIAGGKRPASSMSPSLILDSESGEVRYVLGSAGGIKIISSTAYAYLLHHMLDEDLAVAVTTARFHHQLHPNVVEYESSSYSQAVLDGLMKKGHLLKPMEWFAAVNMIYRDTAQGKILAASDPRRFSRPAGY